MTAEHKDTSQPKKSRNARPRGRRKSGPVHDAIERAAQEEVRGVPAAEILQHLQEVGLDADTARLIYQQIRQRVMDGRRRASQAIMIVGACVLVVGLALLLVLTMGWPEGPRFWQILAGLVSVCGLALFVSSRRNLRRMKSFAAPGSAAGE